MGHAQGNAAAGTAGHQREHQAGRFFRAPVDARPHAQGAPPAPHPRWTHFVMHDFRVPDQRAVAEHPEVAIRAAGQRGLQHVLRIPPRKLGQAVIVIGFAHHPGIVRETRLHRPYIDQKTDQQTVDLSWSDAASTWQHGAAHQKPVDLARSLAAFADRPHHQALTTAHIARGEHLGHIGGIASFVFGARLGIAARVLVDAEGVEHTAHRMHEAHGQQHQIGRQGELAAGHFLHTAVFPFDAAGLELLDLVLVLAGSGDELLGGHRPVARAAFFVAAGGAQLDRPVRPDQRLVLCLRRLRHDLELGDAGRAVAVAGAHAVRAGVAAADHHHMLARGCDLVFQLVSGVDLVLQRQKLHGEVNAIEFAPRHRQIAGKLGAAGQQHRVEVGLQLSGSEGLLGPVGHSGAGAVLGQFGHQHAGAEGHALGLHLRNATVDVALFHFEIGNTVAQQAASAVVLLEHGDSVPRTGKLLRRRQPSRAGADHGHGLAGFVRWQLRRHPAFVPAPVDDGVLDGLDAHRRFIDAQGAGRLARRGTDAPGELGEVVGRVQHVERALPIALPHEVVEVGNDVVDRATVVAERNAAVHAAPSLRLGLVFRQFVDEFLPVLEPHGGGFVLFFLPLEFHESGDFSHGRSLFVVLERCTSVIWRARWRGRRALWLYPWRPAPRAWQPFHPAPACTRAGIL